MAGGLETYSLLFSCYTLLLLGGLIEATQQRGESVVMTVGNGRYATLQIALLAKRNFKLVSVAPQELWTFKLSGNLQLPQCEIHLTLLWQHVDEKRQKQGITCCFWLMMQLKDKYVYDLSLTFCIYIFSMLNVTTLSFWTMQHLHSNSNKLKGVADGHENSETSTYITGNFEGPY